MLVVVLRNAFNHMDTGSLSPFFFIGLVFGGFALVGVFSYAYQKVVIDNRIWKYFFGVFLVWNFVDAFITSQYLWPDQPFGIRQIIVISTAVFLGLPGLLALFRLGRSRE